MTPFAWVTLALLVIIAAVGFDTVIGMNRIGRLRDVPPRPGPGSPAVSIVVAARDEARGIEAAALSLLAQQYPDFEIIAIDDRSFNGYPIP